MAHLLKELSEKFSVKILEPFGSVIPIHASQFDKSWQPLLESQGCKVFTQEYDREMFHFIQLPHTSKIEAHRKRGLRWTSQEDSALKELCSQGLTKCEITRALNRSITTIEHHIKKLGLNLGG